MNTSLNDQPFLSSLTLLSNLHVMKPMNRIHQSMIALTTSLKTTSYFYYQQSSNFLLGCYKWIYIKRGLLTGVIRGRCLSVLSKFCQDSSLTSDSLSESVAGSIMLVTAWWCTLVYRCCSSISRE